MWSQQTLVSDNTHVVILFFVSSLHTSIFSSRMKLPCPILFFLRNSMHFLPVSIVSTTMWSKLPQAVEMATSYWLSIAPRSPCNATRRKTFYFTFIHGNITSSDKRKKSFEGQAIGKDNYVLTDSNNSRQNITTTNSNLSITVRK